MRFIPTFLLFTLFSVQLQAQFYIPVFPNLVGDYLLEELSIQYKPNTVLSYGAARDLMYGTIYNENDSVSCVYTGHSLYLPQGIDPSTHLYMNGSADGINCEHTYPRSKGSDDGNGFSDMHHLFPSRTAINASRSNFPFAEIDDNQTSSWSYLNESMTNIPITNIDLYSESTNGSFEPKEDHKGNVARAVFYFYTMYKADALDADPDFFELQREVLCDWHNQDPVDSMEWQRSFMIGDYQDGLANPFVLDSSLVFRSFCNTATATTDLNESKTLFYPNPVIDILTVTVAGNNNLRVVDLLGRVFIKKEFTDLLELDFSTMRSGIYFVILNGEVFRILKL